MKTKLLLLVLTCTVVLFGCKKDKTPEDRLADAKKQIIGSWKLQSGTAVYYDASGKAIKTENLEIDDDGVFQFVNQTTVKSNNSDDDYSYTLTNVNEKVMVNIDNQSFEVKFNNKMMTWVLEETFTNEDFTRATLTYQFTKL